MSGLVMQASIELRAAPDVQYVLRIADTLLVLGQRLAEWSGRAPILEEDIALANMALDCIGQARSLLSHAAVLDGQGHDEDRLAFLREERDYRNLTLVELPRGDFAVTVVRNVLVAGFLKLLWTSLATSRDETLAAIAGKAVKEARYHQRHASDWLLRLAQGTAESRLRTEKAVGQLWPYVAEWFEADDVDRQAMATGLGPGWSSLQADWTREVESLFAAAGLSIPASTPFRSHGKRGRHSEHLGHLLAEMQHLQRAYPGGAW